MITHQKRSPPKFPLVKCTVTSLTPEEGGRHTPFPPGALSGDTYRPHIVVGDPKQRLAVTVERGWSAEEYIGVAVYEGPHRAQSGTAMRVILTLMYYPHPMYENTLREGSLITGHGEVHRWLD